MRILVIEDNPKMARAIAAGLSQHGYTVEVVHTGFEGEEAAANANFDVIVLDVMLPDRDGLDVCRNLRRRGISTPILMLTALSGTNQKVDGLDAGADDYLAKPFEYDELVARIRALMRRHQSTESSLIRYEGLELDLAKHTVVRQGYTINLSVKEFALLEYLVRNPQRVLTRQTIAERVWNIDYEPSSNVIDVYISALRKKVDRDFEPPLIHTVIGVGYRFGVAADVSTMDL